MLCSINPSYERSDSFAAEFVPTYQCAFSDVKSARFYQFFVLGFYHRRINYF